MGRVVVVTGASAGVGRATALEFARAGARVALLARGREGLEGARREVAAAGAEALIVPTDVAEYGQVEAAAEEVERTWGPIDVWINNAMATVFAPFDELSAEDFERVTQVTYLGGVNGTRAALKRMQQRDRGVIVQVGSALAYRSIPLQSAYCGAKAGLRGFTDAVRCELLHQRSSIRICHAVLAAFNTPQFEWAKTYVPQHPQPVGKVLQPEVAARAIRWLAEHPRREMWIGAPAAQAVLGNRVAPGWLDRMMARKAWNGQFTAEPVSIERPHNLYSPLQRDFGAHGRFDAKAETSSLEVQASMHRGLIAGVLGAGLALAALLRIRTAPKR